jgi:hypothetical protein
MSTIRPGWAAVSPEFEGAFIVSPPEMIEIMEWMKSHGVSKTPTPDVIINLMDVADRESASRHVRHFLWAILHYPELIQVMNVRDGQA